MGCAPLEQLDLDLADAAADLEHARSRDPALLEERNHSPGGLVETALAVALGHPASEPGTEELVAASRVTAARHGSARRPSGSVLASGHSTIAGSGNTRWPRSGASPHARPDHQPGTHWAGFGEERRLEHPPGVCNTIPLAPSPG